MGSAFTEKREKNEKEESVVEIKEDDDSEGFPWKALISFCLSLLYR